MFSFRVIVSLLLVGSAIAGNVVFEDSPTISKDNTDVGTRNGPFDDSVVIEAAGSPSNGEVDSRFFGLLGGNRPIGGGVYGGGYPIGTTKPGRCPGLLGLGIGQPEGGYGGYGGYGYGQQGFGGYPGGYGGHGGYGHHHGAGGYGYPGQYGYGGLGGGYNGGFGFRSADQGGESGDKIERRKRSDEATKESAGGDVQGRSGETDPRFFGAIAGLFGQPCYQDYQCPGQLKCCAKAIGGQASCQQPALLG